jgi:hypothetical protein
MIGLPAPENQLGTARAGGEALEAMKAASTSSKEE